MQRATCFIGVLRNVLKGLPKDLAQNGMQAKLGCITLSVQFLQVFFFCRNLCSNIFLESRIVHFFMVNLLITPVIIVVYEDVCGTDTDIRMQHVVRRQNQQKKKGFKMCIKVACQKYSHRLYSQSIWEKNNFYCRYIEFILNSFGFTCNQHGYILHKFVNSMQLIASKSEKSNHLKSFVDSKM